jgi:hypothetical protein
MTSLEEGLGRVDHAEPSQRSTKIPFVSERTPTARQKVLLEQDTETGCPDVAGLAVVGTGRVVCAHFDPFHSSAGAVPLGCSLSPTAPTDMQNVELLQETDSPD